VDGASQRQVDAVVSFLRRLPDGHQPKVLEHLARTTGFADLDLLRPIPPVRRIALAGSQKGSRSPEPEGCTHKVMLRRANVSATCDGGGLCAAMCWEIEHSGDPWSGRSPLLNSLHEQDNKSNQAQARADSMEPRPFGEQDDSLFVFRL
jgi:hypothetical protein